MILRVLLLAIPASLYIEKSTDSLATYLGQSVGGLVNATFGNLPELFIGVATLRLSSWC